jgi:hypothetical protein
LATKELFSEFRLIPLIFDGVFFETSVISGKLPVETEIEKTGYTAERS